jgi:large subunit ribosomal protein L18e
MSKSLQLNQLISDLYARAEEKDAAIWKTLAVRLSKPASTWSEANLSRIDRLTKKGDVLVIPGKVLGTGTLTHPVEIYAVSASQGAQDAIKKAGGKFGDFNDLINKNPTGKGVRIFK